MRKIYETIGLITKAKKGTVYPDLPFIVHVTKDTRGCTVSIANELLDIQYTIPFDQMLKDLLEDAKNEKN